MVTLDASTPQAPPRAAPVEPCRLTRARAFTPTRLCTISTRPASPPPLLAAALLDDAADRNAPARRPRRGSLTVSIPDARYYRSITGMRRVLRRLEAANVLRGGFPPRPAASRPVLQQRHVVVDIDACCTPLLPTAAHRKQPALIAALALHPALYAVFAVTFLALAGLRYWPH